jgi:predicted small lipoprotein YifL
LLRARNRIRLVPHTAMPTRQVIRYQAERDGQTIQGLHIPATVMVVGESHQPELAGADRVVRWMDHEQALACLSSIAGCHFKGTDLSPDSEVLTTAVALQQRLFEAYSIA